MTVPEIGSRALDLIWDYETGGRGYYEAMANHPHWPGGRSGLTLGAGYDLGYQRTAVFQHDWAAYLGSEDIAALKPAIGVVGRSARRLVPRFRHIRIDWETARAQFQRVTLPRYARKTIRAFPGAELLPPDAFGVLVSLVFNRGSGMGNRRDPRDWNRRREMRAIREALSGAAVESIPGHIRSMTRLWRNNPRSDRDLVDRREAEARLFERTLAEASPPPIPRPKPEPPPIPADPRSDARPAPDTPRRGFF